MVDPDELRVEVLPFDQFPGAAFLRLTGKGGASSVRHLQAEIEPLLAEGKKDFLLDCAGVRFFNSTSLGYLINLADTVRSAGGSVSFCRMPKKVGMTFDLLGLGEMFRFFPGEQEWARQTRPVPAAAPPEPPPAELEMEVVELEDPPAPLPDTALPFPAGLPAWLDEVDHTDSPPLDHLRWSALLQGAVRKMDANPIAQVAERMGVPATGPMIQVLRGVLRKCQSPQDLLGHFDDAVLAAVCRVYGLPVEAGKPARIASLVSFVNRSTTESLSAAVGEAPAESAPAPAPAPVPAAPELTHEKVLGALEGCPLPKLLRSESAARTLIRNHLAKTLGREEVRAGREVGRHLKTKVDVDLGERFGVLVRLAGGLLGKKGDPKKVIAALGQVVLLSGIYGRGNLFVVLVGECKKGEALALGELKGWIDSAGGRVLHLRASP